MKLRARGKPQPEGSILVLVLWSLGLLTVLSLALSVQVRQKITFLSRIEQKSQLTEIAEAGILKAIALLNQDFKMHGQQLTPESKSLLYNNPGQFSSIIVGQGSCSVASQILDGGVDSPLNYGMMDEESKLNLNKADPKILANLLKRVAGLKDEEAESLGRGIVDWRQEHAIEMTGFYSQDFYENLEYPYPVKRADYEVLDELLLIRGMNQRIFDVLKNYVTVYGNGKVNVNTASAIVLLSLGFDEAAVEKVLLVRRGLDNLEATADDFVFERPYDIASDIKAHMDPKDAEGIPLDELNNNEWLGTDSSFYRIESSGSLKGEEKHIMCVYNSNSSKIDYWKEE